MRHKNDKALYDKCTEGCPAPAVLSRCITSHIRHPACLHVGSESITHELNTVSFMAQHIALSLSLMRTNQMSGFSHLSLKKFLSISKALFWLFDKYYRICIR
jgi:hypothetical protein